MEDADFRELSEHYELIGRDPIGVGAFGKVYKAKNRATGGLVAVKKVKNVTFALGKLPQEVKILKKLDHENVIRLIEVVTTGKDAIFLVFDYMDSDLSRLAKVGTLSKVQIKHFFMQLLSAVAYCHGENVVHRDIKGDNILVNENGKLTLADFGCSRFLEEEEEEEGVESMIAEGYGDSAAKFKEMFRNFSPVIMAFPYRPPEILLGSTKYGTEVDIWGVGCLFGELLLEGEKIFPSQDTEDKQLLLIYQICGSRAPDDEDEWPDVFDSRSPPLKRKVRDLFAHLDPPALDLLDQMLVLNPKKRITAAAALGASYFSTLGERGEQAEKMTGDMLSPS